ncbi:MAG: LCP family protein [Veillonellales bacterium]
MARAVRRKVRWGRVVLVGLLFFLLVVSVTGAARYLYNSLLQPAVAAKGQPAADGKRPDVINNHMNILLLGLDDGDLEHPGAPQRSDTMIVASINYDDGTVSLLSIPRDTKVTIPGHKGFDKINHAHYYGGPQLAAKTVEDFLQMPISYYAVIDWQAFIRVMDLIGGVDLYVERNMDYEDPYANLKIHLKNGYQHLDGEKAGEYVRFRSDELGDIGRVQRQQRFLKAVGGEMLQLSTMAKLPLIIGTAKQYVATDITAVGLLKAAYGLKGIKNGSLQAEMLPGKFATIDGLSYWVADNEQTSQLVERMLHSGTDRMSGMVYDGARK